jgi:mevalonate kinase
VATAPGKAILFGEHAVVYGHPAVAVPVFELQARVEIRAHDSGLPPIIVAPDIGLRESLLDLPLDNPLAAIVRATLRRLRVPQPAGMEIRVTSTIPVARGLGSGAAVSVAMVRALARYFDTPLTSRDVSDLAYEVEKLHHGTPSGIDNTVIAFGKPVYFVRDVVSEIFWVSRPFQLLVADTGIPNPTRDVVDAVRGFYEAEPARLHTLFDEIGEIANAGRAAIETGRVDQLGRLMNRNQELLERVGVSCPEIDRLVAAARQAGALGAKLSGAGRGGHVVCLVDADCAGRVEMHVRFAGARSTVVTEVR